MKITHEKLSVITCALNTAYKPVSIEFNANLLQAFLYGDEVEFTINWAGIGSVNPEDARAYGSAIVNASEIAKAMNGMKLEIEGNLEYENPNREEELHRMYEAVMNDDIKAIKRYIKG